MWCPLPFPSRAGTLVLQTCVILLACGCAESHLAGETTGIDIGVELDGDIPTDADVVDFSFPPGGDMGITPPPVDGGLGDNGPGSDGGTPRDLGPADAGVDQGPPPPECTSDGECDDMDDCSTDSCVAGFCVNDNPDATCGRFEGVDCASDLATDLLTLEQTFCIPGFAVSQPGLGSVSVCEGERCSPTDTEDGCLLTLRSVGDPATVPDPDTLRVSGRLTAVDGSVAFTGVVPNPIGGGTLAIDCDVSFEVGSGLPLGADLNLGERMMCGTDRTVTAEADVDLSMLSVSLSGTGLNGIICNVIEGVLAGQTGPLTQGIEPALEAGINAALSTLDCGSCDADCPASLTCLARTP